jgi:hypothetical protein
MHKLLLLLSVFSIGLLAGCDNAGTTAAPPAEEHLIRTLVSQTAEYQADPRRFASCLAEGSNVDEALRNKLKGLMAKLDRATIDESGTSATASVLFEVLETGDQLGPVEWALEKTGDEWKVKTLAVPDLPQPTTN